MFYAVLTVIGIVGLAALLAAIPVIMSSSNAMTGEGRIARIGLGVFLLFLGLGSLASCGYALFGLTTAMGGG